MVKRTATPRTPDEAEKPRTARPPGAPAYYATLQRIFRLQSQMLTAALPHAGERGANDEERCRAFLADTLPREYSVGTGFVVSWDAALPMSRQQDVVVHDAIYNSPLHREISASVFPVEMVYGVVEVKGRLASSDLVPLLQSVAEIRALGSRSAYHVYGNNDARLGASPGLVTKTEVLLKRPPRAFVFAYDAVWTRPERFERAWQVALDKVGAAHIHGVVVLSKDWYLYQLPYQKLAKTKLYTDNALLRFMNGMLTTLRATLTGRTAMDRYIKLPTPGAEE